MGLLKSDVENAMGISDNRELPGWEIYNGDRSPTAMMRAQQRLEIPWILEKIRRHIGYHANILDLGCGFGTVTNELANKGHAVTGLDHSAEALDIAKAWDKTQSVQYRLGDIHSIPFANKSFDVVTAMDVLSHINESSSVFQEATRVLRPGGIFIFNNYNHSRLAWLMAVKGPQWLIKEAAEPYHDYERFQKPMSLARQLKRAGLNPIQFCGLRPVMMQRSLIKLIYSGCVSDQFRFQFCRQPWLGYIGVAQKQRFY
jgi:2-polyprenyl-6-hydroxyphenyl methylase/3-demethylubiquinone-9 3-methyltransferase